MGGFFERISRKNKDDSNSLKPLEDFFEESKRDLEALLKKPRIKKKVVVVSYNITHILIAVVVCLFLTGILTVYYFLPSHKTATISVMVGEDSGVSKTKAESPEAKMVCDLRERLQEN